MVDMHLSTITEFEFTRHTQNRADHYKTVFNMIDDPDMPSYDESYMADFFRSADAENSQAVIGIMKDTVIPAIDAITGRSFELLDFRVMKMGPGSFIRAHTDKYLGSHSFVYYLHTDWKADWGGLLCWKPPKSSELCVHSPKKGEIVLFPNDSTRHFVTQVAGYALNSRYSIAGFGHLADPHNDD